MGTQDAQGEENFAEMFAESLGQDNVKDLAGLATPVPVGAELSLLPAVSGG